MQHGDQVPGIGVDVLDADGDRLQRDLVLAIYFQGIAVGNLFSGTWCWRSVARDLVTEMKAIQMRRCDLLAGSAQTARLAGLCPWTGGVEMTATG